MSTQMLPSADIDTLFNGIVRLPLNQREKLFIRLLENGIKLLSEPVDEEAGNEVPSTNPDNPSPSGDPWFDNPRNLKILDDAVAAHKAGEKGTPLEDCTEILKIFAECRQ